MFIADFTISTEREEKQNLVALFANRVVGVATCKLKHKDSSSSMSVTSAATAESDQEQKKMLYTDKEHYCSLSCDLMANLIIVSLERQFTKTRALVHKDF